MKRSSRRQRCSLCKKPGHNKRTCSLKSSKKISKISRRRKSRKAKKKSSRAKVKRKTKVKSRKNKVGPKNTTAFFNAVMNIYTFEFFVNNPMKNWVRKSSKESKISNTSHSRRYKIRFPLWTPEFQVTIFL